MASSLISEAESLFAAGRHQQGLELLGNAARQNDADALNYLARMAVFGDIVHRDLRLARDLFRRSGAAGSASGAAAYRAFLAHGTGGPRNWSEALDLLESAGRTDPVPRRELELISAMALDEQGAPIATFEPERLSNSLEALLFQSLFSAEECDFLIDIASPALQPSKVVDPQTGAQVPNPVRTSDAVGFPLIAESPAIHALCRRLAMASGTEVKQGEPLQILRYRPGQQYRPHFDAIGGADNQRVLTFLVYLNEDYDGGETEFITPGLRVKGRKGDGLLFRNADASGRADPNSQHAGLPVTGGEKFLASRWIRERPLAY